MKATFFSVLTALAMVSMSAFCIEPGLYADPESPGHGVAVFEAPEDHRVITWYTYDELDGQGGQAWFISDNFLPGNEVDLYQPDGIFPSFGFELGDPVGSAVVTDNQSRLLVRYELYLWSQNCSGQPQPSPAPPYCFGSVSLNLLARQ